MVAKPSKVYTKLQGNVDKMNVRHLSSQFSHEHLKLSNVHGKIRKKVLNSFCQHFLVHSFPLHLCDPIYKFVFFFYQNGLHVLLTKQLYKINCEIIKIKINREKAFNKTMTKRIQKRNNIFWMLRQWWKSRIKWLKKHGSKK